MYPAVPQQQQQQSSGAAAARQDYDYARHASSSARDSGSFYTAPGEKRASGYDNAQYPSLASQHAQQPSAPSFDVAGVPHAQAVPAYYSHDNTQQQQQQQQLQQQPSYQAAQTQYGYPAYHPLQGYPQAPPPPVPRQFLSPVRSGDYRRHGCVGTTLKLFFFHCLNAVLGIGGFVIVLAGTNIAIGLIPLCCIGIVLFRGVLLLVGKLAMLDVKLYNYISPTSEHVYVDIPRETRLIGHISGRRLSPQLSSFSPLALMAALYFGTIKLALGVLSCVAVAMFGGLIGALVAVVSDPDGLGNDVAFQLNDESIRVRDNAAEFALMWLCLFVISIALMHLFARVSRALTRFFCCEKFSTYRYIYVAQHPQEPTRVGYGTY